MDLGDRMKLYEGRFQQDLCPLVPAIARLDGRAFHTFCSKMEKPFDVTFHNIMVGVAIHLVKETGARLGYTQSDEISLLYYSDTFDSQIFFDGNVIKMVSTMAAIASVYFNECAPEKWTSNKRPTFDCRIANYPIDEVANYFIWREQDAVRNSIQAAAQANFSHHSIQGLNCDQLQEKLWKEKGINWNDYSPAQKRGTYVRTTRVVTKFTTEELEKLPPKHHAHKNPELEFERHRVEIVELPILTKVKNRTEVVLYGAECEAF